MELIIGERIRNLRISRNLKQEEVAKHLGISFQAVSKWERGDGYPDITMLPAIAGYFSVTVDELLGMDEIASVSSFEKINEEWKVNRECGRHIENVELMKNALKVYPNNALLLVQLSASLERLTGTDEQRRENLWESIQVQERILKYCEDSEVRGATIFNLSDAYYRYGDTDKALEYAYKLPNLYKARENALVRILPDGEEKKAAAEAAIKPLLWALELHLTELARLNKDETYLEKWRNISNLLS